MQTAASKKHFACASCTGTLPSRSFRRLIPEVRVCATGGRRLRSSPSSAAICFQGSLSKSVSFHRRFPTNLSPALCTSACVQESLTPFITAFRRHASHWPSVTQRDRRAMQLVAHAWCPAKRHHQVVAAADPSSAPMLTSEALRTSVPRCVRTAERPPPPLATDSQVSGAYVLLRS